MQIVSVILTDNIHEVLHDAKGNVTVKAFWSDKRYTYLAPFHVEENDIVMAGVYNKITYGKVVRIQRNACAEDLVHQSLKPLYGKMDTENLKTLFTFRHAYERAKAARRNYDPFAADLDETLGYMRANNLRVTPIFDIVTARIEKSHG